MPYSPLGRGLMTGSINTLDQLPEGDHRRNSPRFASENFEHNKDLVSQFAAIAADLGCTSGQLAIAWLLAQGDDVVPILGTKRRTYLRENAAAVDVVLSTELAAQIADLMSAVAGDRYGWGHTYGDSPALGSTSN